MGEPVTASKTNHDQAHVNTVLLCPCVGALKERAKAKNFKEGAKGNDVKCLHEHLIAAGFKLELSNSKSGTAVDSDDLKKDQWGPFTTRALRMFGKHPQVDKESESILNINGKMLTEPLTDKLAVWCLFKTVSPQDYWNFRQLSIPDGTAGKVDAFGDDLSNDAQDALHHYIRQIQTDLSKIGFGVHADAICAIGKAPRINGHYWEAPGGIDKELRDLKHLVAKFQRQAAWLWRMDKGGTHLPDVKPGDPSHFGGSDTGVLDHAGALILHEWADKGLHMVMDKFPLKSLHWPPTTTTVLRSDSGGAAKLREDAYGKWLEAAKEINLNSATIEGPYASSPRGWRSGKQSSGGDNSAWSWHYAALGVDISQEMVSSDGTSSPRFRYVLEEDNDRFRLWCYQDPQPEAPADPTDDKKDPVVQYRNRNIRYKRDVTATNLFVKPGEPSDAAPLAHITFPGGSSTPKITAKTGWYVDITSILEANGLKRIRRHGNWKTSYEGREWWHYQYAPPPPSWLIGDFTFGEYLQLIGVHEYLLRNTRDGWPTHDDVDHTPG